MPPSSNGPSGMGYERKKRSLTSIPIRSPIASSSSSTMYRYTQGSANGHYPPRSESPPASAYFPLLSAGDPNAKLQPTPDAEAHFSYSTTLRRHQTESAAALASPAVFAAAVNAEASSLWTRAINYITGNTNQYQAVDSGRETPPAGPKEEKRDTASAQFAHCSIEVCYPARFFFSFQDYILTDSLPRIPLHIFIPQEATGFYTRTYLVYAKPMAIMNSPFPRPNLFS